MNGEENNKEIIYHYLRLLSLSPRLLDPFPEVFAFAINSCCSVEDAGFWQDDLWHWNLAGIVESSNPVVQNLGGEIVALLNNITLTREEEDSFGWLKNDEGIFTVRSCYSWLTAETALDSVSPGVLGALSSCWNSAAPLKMQYFGWRLLHDRLPSKDQLFKRGIITEITQLRCVFCSFDESAVHLFVSCPFADNIWRKVYDWIGSITELSLDEFKSFLFNCEKILSKRKRRVVSVIWFVSVWSIWLMRNDIIFNNVSPSFVDCMSAIVFRSWNWLSSFCKIIDCCNFYTWNSFPLFCFEMK
ncbi:uncharacterized protein LOC131656564 [Vicia villosa]|uniref:uncharacterized protein LOC131656564 n=1 Tax=Vicia villosa TaxID=3911 RepID=UPI00273B65B3|nr:uncharacterized protein LOC131656564 [Vicia villosa]